jgi:hypothetical protein
MHMLKWLPAQQQSFITDEPLLEMITTVVMSWDAYSYGSSYCTPV